MDEAVALDVGAQRLPQQELEIAADRDPAAESPTGLAARGECRIVESRQLAPGVEACQPLIHTAYPGLALRERRRGNIDAEQLALAAERGELQALHWRRSLLDASRGEVRGRHVRERDAAVRTRA